MILKTMDQIQDYLESQKIPRYESYDISEIPNISNTILRSSILSHLQEYLRLPEFLMKDVYINNDAILLDIRSMYEYYTGDTTFCVEYIDDIITDIHPDKYLPIGILNSVKRIISSMSDNYRVYLVEMISDDSGYSILYTTDRYIEKGGIVFRFYNTSTSISVREYLKFGDIIVYLPSKYYNKTSGRYDRFTNDYSLSIDTLVQKVLSEIETPDFISNLLDHHMSINMKDRLTLEEVSNILNTIDDIDVIKLLLEPYEDDKGFIDSYSDYLWRCTNIHTKTTANMIKELSDSNISEDIRSTSYFRETCGTIFSGKKIEDRLFSC